MALNMSVTLRNARLDAIETVAGASAILKMRTGAKPANCAAADSGTVVATLSLPSDWMSAAASGVKALLGTWADKPRPLDASRASTSRSKVAPYKHPHPPAFELTHRSRSKVVHCKQRLPRRRPLAPNSCAREPSITRSNARANRIE